MKKIIITLLLLTASTLIYSQGMDLNHKKIHIVDSTMGLGISPTSRLHIFGNGTTSGLLNITNDKDATKDSSVVVDAVGNVGIKTITPRFTLDVIGSLGISNVPLGTDIDSVTVIENGQLKSVDASNLGLVGLTGTTGQTIYHNGSNWVSTSNLFNSGTKVGIGTTTPTYKLQISDGNGGEQLRFTRGTGEVTFDQSLNKHNLVINATDGFIINTGNVGIGTISPAWKLVVSKNGETGLEIDPDNGISGKVGVYSYDRVGQVYKPLYFEASLYELLGGNVGIGTTSPTSRLHVFGNGTASNLFNVTNDKDATKDSSVVIDAIGNVGIGKTPTSRLEVVDGLNAYGGSVPLAIARTMTNNKIAFIGSAVTNLSEIYPDYNIGLYGTASGGTNNFAGYFNLGNVYVKKKLGIGTLAPTYRFEVFGNNDGGATDLMKISNDINSTYDSTFVIQSSGYVGIGTTTPLYNLDIGGGGTSDVNSKIIRINSSNKEGSAPLLGFAKADTIRGSIGIYPASISSNKNDFTIESDWESNIVLTTSRSEKHLEIDQNGNLIAYKEIMWRDSLGDYQKGITLSDNETYALPTGYSWKGEIDVDSLGYTLFTAQIRCDADGTPYLEGVSWKRWSSITYVEAGYTDGYLNITDGGSGMAITNTLGYTIKATLRFRTKQ